MAVLEELEETARLTLLTANGCESLTDIDIDELRRAFGARW
jgi:3-dehydro-4-phosphotetronate decarboxylase